MYDRAIIIVRISGVITRESPITIGLHQVSALSSYIFSLFIDELTRPIKDEVPWCLIFVDDIILLDEIRRGANIKLEALNRIQRF